LDVGDDVVVFRAMEVGFNGGHSAAMTLSVTAAGGLADSGCTNNRTNGGGGEHVAVHVTAFDLCHHPYTRPNADELVAKFANRFTLICGDSQHTLPDFLRPGATFQDAELESDHDPRPAQATVSWAHGGFDFAFVDGLHTYEGALSDLCQAWRLASEGATVVVDDCDMLAVADAWATVVKAGAVRPRRSGVGWQGICIGRWSRPPPPPEEMAALFIRMGSGSF
jgi:hypothetical protein